MNVIKQIVSDNQYGQTIKMIVKDNERGPQGKQGEPGSAATITAGNAYTVGYGETPQVMNTGTASEATFDFYIPEGKPGAIHYTAGPGIIITEDNQIEATGEMAVYWGDLEGSIDNQTDLKDALDAKQDKLTAGTNVQISGTNEISATDTTYNDFTGTDGSLPGTAGLVPAPTADKYYHVLKATGTWGSIVANNISDDAIITNKIGSNAVTTAKIADGAVTNAKLDTDAVATSNIASSAVTKAKMDFTGFEGNYSYNEIDTGYTWVDGSEIYKKTIHTGALPNTATTISFQHNVANLKDVVKIEGVATDGATHFSRNLPMASVTAFIGQVSIGVSDTVVDVTTGGDRSSYTDSYVTIWYTKSS